MKNLEKLIRDLVAGGPSYRDKVIHALRIWLRNGGILADLTRYDVFNLTRVRNDPIQRKVTPELLEKLADPDNATRDQLCEYFEGESRFLRQKLLGTHKPLSETKAYQWADAQFHQQWEKARRTQAKVPVVFLCFTSKERKPMPIPVLPGDQKLDAFFRGHWDEQTMSYLGGVRGIVEHTGFDEAETAWWIFTGKRPTLPRCRLQGHESCLTGHAWITLEIHAADLTWKELWELYHERLRPFINSKRQKVNPLHYRICQLVDEAGGVPEEGRIVFWEGIRQKLEREKKGKKVPQWQGIRSAYYRFSKIHAED